MPKDAVIISVKDSYDMHAVEFYPLRDAGPHVPLSEVNALSLFEWFFDDTILDAVYKKNEKRKRYELFMRNKLTKAEIIAFLGALILLGIHSVRNHRKALEC